MTHSKEQNVSPEVTLKKTQRLGFLRKDILKNCLKYAQRAKGKHEELKVMRKVIHENVNTEIKIIKRNQKEILQLKNRNTKFKKSLE
jgi:hypothetical protein